MPSTLEINPSTTSRQPIMLHVTGGVSTPLDIKLLTIQIYQTSQCLKHIIGMVITQKSDPWLEMEDSFFLFGVRAVYELGQAKHLTVNNFIENGAWSSLLHFLISWKFSISLAISLPQVPLMKMRLSEPILHQRSSLLF